ncbi:MAG TPA: MerR family transcriptional regulator [Kofleriaceae bacterium]
MSAPHVCSWGSRLFDRHRNWNRETPSTDNVVPFRAHRSLLETDVAARGGDGESNAGGGVRTTLLQEEELRAIETQHAEGMTAVQIVDAFTSRRIKFSEASFRKYVQQGLLPRSKRVGRKGKHKGSLGMYPAKTIRRINTVKQWMSDGYTIEEIQGQFLLYTDLVEGIGEHLTALYTRLDADSQKLDTAVRAQLHKELEVARKDGDRLTERLGDLARRTAAPRTDNLRLAGAAGGAEDLL